MQNGTINFVEYFEEKRKSFESELQAHKIKMLQYAKTKFECNESMKPLQQEIDNKMVFKKQATDNGLDTSPIDVEIARLREAIDQLQSKHDEHVQLMSLPEPIEPYDKEKVSKFLAKLKSHGIVEAEVLPSIEDAISLFTVLPNELTINDCGLVVKAKIRFAKHYIGDVLVSPENGRYIESFIPKSLDWMIPRSERFPKIEKHEPVISDETSKAFVINNKYILLLPRQYNRNNTVKSVVMDFTGDEVQSTLPEEMLADAYEQVGNVIRLDQTCQVKLIEHIRSEIVSLTVQKLRWEDNTEYPDSEQVFQSIRNELSLLVAAPWSDELNGCWAMLKYTLENGERPRVWRKKHVNHYGLRVRTRDHTWIKCDIFMDQSKPSGKLGDPIVRNLDNFTLNIGRMCVSVSEASN